VDEDAAFAYYYNEHDTAEHLRRLAFRAMCRVAASQDFLKWVAEERSVVLERYLAVLDEGVEQANLGVEVLDATINAVHPPAEIARAYEQVVTALEKRESLIQEGEQESNRRLQRADAQQTEMLEAATAYDYYQRVLAEAEAELFEARAEVYEKAPLVYLYRTYLDAIERAVRKQRVFVVPESENEVQIIDLQEKIRPFILDDLDALEE
jgi:membrane protease subunit HflK